MVRSVRTRIKPPVADTPHPYLTGEQRIVGAGFTPAWTVCTCPEIAQFR